VICGPPELDPGDPRRQTVTNPRAVVEILSPSTAAYDRTTKLDHYRQCASLDSIVLVAHDRRRVEAWTRTGGRWTEAVALDEATAILGTLEIELPLGEIYRDLVGSDDDERRVMPEG
jgi:Uma2 family endonuclease